MSRFWSFCRHTVWRGLHWGFKFPFYVRMLIGVFLIVLGFFGILPILGFWMIPLGILLIGTALPWTSDRIKHWMATVEPEIRTHKN
ncbi:MAG: DUF2892 domain-containing protein [Gammaproteobacteria bacterium]|nr:DUF2892 domain-containing protein [Gammaproteobacteria bacterium]